MQHNRGRKARAEVRRKTHLIVSVTYLSRQLEGRVVDLSPAGIAIDLKGFFVGAAGNNVRIECDKLGIIEGTVRWARSGRIGIEFSHNSNTAAQVASYFRFSHKL